MTQSRVWANVKVAGYMFIPPMVKLGIGYDYFTNLVVWNMFYFPYIGNVIIQTDELIFFRGVGQPPSTNMIPMIDRPRKQGPLGVSHGQLYLLRGVPLLAADQLHSRRPVPGRPLNQPRMYIAVYLKTG